jgi:hypothetical protein
MRHATLELSSRAARSIVKLVGASASIKRFKRASAPAPFERSVNAPLASGPIAAAAEIDDEIPF